MSDIWIHVNVYCALFFFFGAANPTAKPISNITTNPSTHTPMKPIDIIAPIVTILLMFFFIDAITTTDLQLVRVDAIEEVEEGGHLYTLSSVRYQRLPYKSYTGCLDANIGSMVMFEHKKAYLTGRTRSVEPHEMFKCP